MPDEPTRGRPPREPSANDPGATAQGEPAEALRSDALYDGSLARRIVTGTVAQQGGQVAGGIVSLATTTVLARTFSLAEFGVYGVVVSLATYFHFALGSAETAAVRDIASATGQQQRNSAYTTALTVYAGLGVVVAVAIAAGGQLLLDLFTIPDALDHQARLGVAAVGLMTGVGFPLRLHLDLLRGSHEFSLAGLAETLGWISLGMVQMLLLLVFDAPLWLVTAVGGGTVAFLGLASLVVLRGARVPYRLEFSKLRITEVGALLRTTSALLAISSTELLVTSLDRAVLAAFRPAAVVGLYEAAARVNNIVRAFTGSLSLTVLPVTSRLASLGDHARERELIVMGTRYMLAAVVPPTVTLMVLADRVLAVWLGPKYAAAGTAVAIFLFWWLLSPNSSVASAIFVVESRFKRLFVYSWTIALVNLGASLALASQYGLNGVAAGTTIGYLAVFPFFMRFVFKRHSLSVREFVRNVWLPAYGTGAVLACCLLVVRQVMVLDQLLVVLIVAALALASYWAAFAAVWLTPEERRMFLGFLRPSPER